MRSALFFVCVCLWGLCAHAVERRRLDFKVSRDLTDCPDADGLRSAVASKLGYDPFTSDAEPLVVVRIDGSKRQLKSAITFLDARGKPTGERRLTAQNCAELASATAFAIGMAIDPMSAIVGKSAGVETPAKSSAPVENVTLNVTNALREEPKKWPPAGESKSSPTILRLHLSGGVAALSQVTSVAALVGFGIGMRRGAFGLELEGRFLAPASESAALGRVRTSTLAGAVLPCAHVRYLFFCGQFVLGALQGEALDIESANKETTVFAQAGVRLGARVHLPHGLALEPFVDGLATLTRTRLNFRGREVWATSPLGVEGGVRLVLNIL